MFVGAESGRSSSEQLAALAGTTIDTLGVCAHICPLDATRNQSRGGGSTRDNRATGDTKAADRPIDNDNVQIKKPIEDAMRPYQNSSRRLSFSPSCLSLGSDKVVIIYSDRSPCSYLKPTKSEKKRSPLSISTHSHSRTRDESRTIPHHPLFPLPPPNPKPQFNSSSTWAPDTPATRPPRVFPPWSAPAPSAPGARSPSC